MQVDVAEAARILGITHDAVRARIRRGSLEAVKEGGTWRVILPDDAHDAGQDADTTATGHDRAGDTPPAALVAQLQSENAYLRDQLDKAHRTAERERERADVLQREALDRLQSMIPIALGAPESPGSSQGAANDHARVESPAGDTTPDRTRQGGVWQRIRALFTG